MMRQPIKPKKKPPGLLWALASPSLFLGTPDVPWFQWLHAELEAERKAGVQAVAVSRDEFGTTIRIGKVRPQPSPDPWIAAGASLLVPGAGQVYAGAPWRGGFLFGSCLFLFGLARAVPDWGNACSYGLWGASVLAPLDAFWLASPK